VSATDRPRPAPAGATGGVALRPSLDVAIATTLGVALVLLGFLTTGGFDGSVTISAPNTWTEIVLILLGTGVVCALIVLGARAPAWGAAAVALFAALTALTALSILWSVQPDASWQAANLTLAYLMTFAAGAALARIAPERWRSLVAGLAVVAVLLSAYALLAKVFPGSLAATYTEGRLQVPLGYWNATGALAAMGIGPCLWGFTRPDGPRVLRGLAVPGGTVLTAVVVLTFSRTALATTILILAAWLILAPGRLRGVLLTTLSAVGAAVICAWALAHPALTTDGVTLTARTSAGHTFGVVVLIVVLIEIVAGVAAARAVDVVELGEPLRRRIGTVLIGLAALLPVAGILALAVSSRGLTGQISHAWSSLTSTNAAVGESASRITQFGSSRPLYWSQGITVGEHALFKGVGALGYATARTQYTKNVATVGHAHSYVIQTFADLGLLGLLVSLALLVAWGRAAARTLAPRSRWSEFPPEQSRERSGLLALLLFVVGFGLSSAFDWTWYFPAVTVPALLAAGWLAGRGPLAAPVGRAASRLPALSRPGALGACSALVLVSLVCAWLVWQPLRSADDAAAVFSASNASTAFDDARAAEAADPLSLQPHFVLSQLYSGEGNAASARGELLRAVQLQPRNYESWFALGSYDLRRHQAALALPSLRRAYTLNPTVSVTIDTLAQATSEAARPGG
jgi:O-antigen ligase